MGPAPGATGTVTGFWLLPWLRGIKAYVYGFPLIGVDYDPPGYWVPNATDRYHVAMDAARVQRRRSLDISIQAASPGEKKESNWLPRARARAVQPHGADLLADGHGARRHLQASTGEELGASQHEQKEEERETSRQAPEG